MTTFFDAEQQRYENENYEPPSDEDICFACEHGHHNRCEREFHNRGRWSNCSCGCDGEEIEDDEPELQNEFIRGRSGGIG